jgi:hypothetical protein
MQAAYRITTTVLPGHKIEFEVPDSTIGDAIEVFVVLPEKKPPKIKNILEFLEEVHQKGPFRTTEEIDRDLLEERNSWDD